MKLFTLGAFFAIACSVHAIAQDEPDTTLPQYGWEHSLVAGATISQVALSNWEQGGEDALAWTVLADGKSENDQEKVNWESTYKLAFGQAKIGDVDYRKTDDVIDLQSVLTYKLGVYVNPYASVTARTQFATGFTYDSTGKGTPVSRIVDPLYLTQTTGFGYQPIAQFKTRLGVGLREVITSDFNKYADDAETPEIEKILVEGGLESVTELDWEPAENVLLTSKLQLFAPFNTLDKINVHSTTGLSLKAAEILTAIITLELLNDQRVSTRTQLKQSLAFGLSFSIL